MSGPNHLELWLIPQRPARALWEGAKAMGEVGPGGWSRRRGCHFADTPSAALLKTLLKMEGGAAE